MSRSRDIILLAHPEDRDHARQIADAFAAAGIEVTLEPISARSALAGEGGSFATLLASPNAIVTAATERLFSDLYAVDFLACLSKRRPVCFLMAESIPLPLGFGDAYVALTGDVARLSKRDLRSLARPPGRTGARPLNQIGDPFSRMRPILINRQRLIELTEPRFKRHAAITLSLCCLAPIAFLAAMYTDAEAHRSTASEMAKGIALGIIGRQRIDGLLAAFAGGGVLLFSLLLMLQFATSRELTWQNNSVSRPLFNVVFWICLVGCALLSFPLASSQSTGQELQTDGLSLLGTAVVMLPRTVTAFLVLFFMLVPILAAIILIFRLLARSWRIARRAVSRLLFRRGKVLA